MLPQNGPTSKSLKMYRGQRYAIRLTAFRNGTTTRQPLTGLTLHVRVKASKDDPDEDALLDLATGDGITHEADQSTGAATEGQAVAVFTSAWTLEQDAGTCIWDAWTDNGAGDIQPVVLPGPLTIMRGVYSPAPAP